MVTELESIPFFLVHRRCEVLGKRAREENLVRAMFATCEQSVIRMHARLPSALDPLGFSGEEAIAQEVAGLGTDARAQCSHHRSDLCAVEAGDPRVMGIVSARPQSAQASSTAPERRAPTRVHLLALSGGSASRPRHEPRGLYARKAASANVRIDGYDGLSQEKRWHRYSIRTVHYQMTRSYNFQMSSTTYFTCSLIHQGQLAPVNGADCLCPILCPTRCHSVADSFG